MMKRHSSHVREPPTQYLKGIKQARSMFCAVCGLNAGESFGYQGCLDERKDTSMSMDSQGAASCCTQHINAHFRLRALIHLYGVWWGCREQPEERESKQKVEEEKRDKEGDTRARESKREKEKDREQRHRTKEKEKDRGARCGIWWEGKQTL
eukprot:scaffold11194_cov25-Tisochrysis_lutea.AAC.3